MGLNFGLIDLPISKQFPAPGTRTPTPYSHLHRSSEQKQKSQTKNFQNGGHSIKILSTKTNQKIHNNSGKFSKFSVKLTLKNLKNG